MADKPIEEILDREAIDKMLEGSEVLVTVRKMKNNKIVILGEDRIFNDPALHVSVYNAMGEFVKDMPGRVTEDVAKVLVAQAAFFGADVTGDETVQ